MLVLQPTLYLLFFLMIRPPPSSTLFAYTTLFRSRSFAVIRLSRSKTTSRLEAAFLTVFPCAPEGRLESRRRLRSEEHTLNSSHTVISYAVFCLKKKKKNTTSLRLK